MQMHLKRNRKTRIKQPLMPDMKFWKVADKEISV